MGTTHKHVSKNISTTLHEVYHEMNNNWKTVTTWHSSDPKKIMQHITLPNSLMFETSDRYSILAGIKEKEVVTSQTNGTQNI
jgi:hypothetical protein